MRDGAGSSVVGPDAGVVQRVCACAYGTGRIHSAWPSWSTEWSGLWWHVSIRRAFWWRPSSIVYRKPSIFCWFPAALSGVSSTIFRSPSFPPPRFLFDIFAVVLRILRLSRLPRLVLRLFLLDARFLSSVRLFVSIFRTE